MNGDTLRIERANAVTLLLTGATGYRGFDKLPDKRRLEAFPRNEGGWSQQVKNIAAHVEQAP